MSSVVAMGDRSRFGLAKSMFAAATDEGVDMTDADELHAGWKALQRVLAGKQPAAASTLCVPRACQRRTPPPWSPLAAEDDVTASKGGGTDPLWMSGTSPTCAWCRGADPEGAFT
jgi:hypothetical protein